MTPQVLLAGLGAIILILSACSSEPTPTPTPAPTPLPIRVPFDLVAIPEPSFQFEVNSPLNLPSAGFNPLAHVQKRISGELGGLDVFEMKDRLFAAITIQPGGYVLVEATDPTQPINLGAWQVKPSGNIEHIRAFRQDERWYLALPFEANTSTPPTCAGLAIVEVTDPENPVLVDVHNGSSAGAAANWCGAHSIEVITNEDGDAEHLIITSQDTFDLRVLDIRDLDNVQESNFYHLHVHPHSDSVWAHHTNVVDDRIYVSFWDGGVMVLDKAALLAGESADQVELTSQEGIGAPDFTAHDSSPSTNGDYLFVNDAFLSKGGLRVFDIRDPASPLPIMTVDIEGLQTQRHTLLVQDDLLFVPWFAYGVRAFRYDFSQPDQPALEQVAFQEVREEPRDDVSGIDAVATHSCLLDGEIRTCVFASDVSRGLIILALEDV